jgi:altronate dehydratase small subunit
MIFHALVLDKKDNVATAIRRLEKGKSVNVGIEDSIAEIALLQAIHFGHKFAMRDIQHGELVIKYGEAIGQATTKIRKGEHVHIHNVEGLKGRGDKL